MIRTARAVFLPATLLVLSWTLLATDTGCALRSRGKAHASTASTPVALRASCKGRLIYEGKSVRFEAAMVFKGPGRVYMEISGPVGGTRAILAVSADRLVVLLPPRREFIEERATPAAYERLLGMRLTAATLFDLLATAGEDGTRRLPAEPGLDGEASVLLVTVEGPHVRAVPETPGRPGLESLDLRLRERESARLEDVPDALFEVEIPEGWTRLTSASDEAGVPLLFSPS